MKIIALLTLCYFRISGSFQVVGNHKKKSTWSNLERLIWLASLAKTENLHTSVMYSIRDMNPTCYSELLEMDTDQWCMNHINLEKNRRLFHMSTSFGAESEMNRFKRLGLRYSSPFGLFEGAMTLWISMYSKSVSEGCRLRNQNCFLTEHGTKLHLEQVKGSTDDIEKVIYDTAEVYCCLVSKKYCAKRKIWEGQHFKVSKITGDCTCDTNLHMGIMCMHKLSMPEYRNMLSQGKHEFYKKFIDPCWWTSTYIHCYSKDNVPNLPSDALVLSDIDCIEGPRKFTPRGRPKDARIKGGKRNTKSQKEEAKRKMVARAQGGFIISKEGLFEDSIVNSADEEEEEEEEEGEEKEDEEIGDDECADVYAYECKDEFDHVNGEHVDGSIDLSWLNDEKLNSYMELLRDEDKTSHFFRFMLFILKNDYRRVERWTRKINIFCMDKVYCPLNVDNKHWALVVIFMKDRKIVFYDSMGHCGSIYLKSVLNYLEHVSCNQEGSHFCREDWELISARDSVPQQQNGYDCGVYTAMYAHYISKGLPLEFGPKDATSFRERINKTFSARRPPETEHDSNSGDESDGDSHKSPRVIPKMAGHKQQRSPTPISKASKAKKLKLEVSTSSDIDMQDHTGTSSSNPSIFSSVGCTIRGYLPSWKWT